MSALKRVLVVEDDPTSLEYLRVALQKAGCAVTAAVDAESAQVRLAEERFESFDCVVTDYRMPGQSGLELLGWLKQQAPSLATIILTAEGEKKLVTDSLRRGAADFLEKPVGLRELRAAVERAVEQTRRCRRSDEVESAVKELGRTQERLVSSRSAAGDVGVEICFHPKLEAGGDSFSHFQPEPGKYFCLLTDVSGHDLQAAYLSAYFQGVVRGMLDCGRPVPEIFSNFNRYLGEEWNPLAAAHGACEVNASVAVCSVWMDLRERTASIMTCGVPAPVYVEPDGRATLVGASGGFPLGWFPEFAPESVRWPLVADGSVLLWTDGVEDLADRIGVSPLSIGHRLRSAPRPRELPELQEAADDILFAALRMPGGRPGAGGIEPLILERYEGSEAGRIDELAAGWLRCLAFALPELSGAVRHDVLLASREAVLNGLEHGCGGRSGSALVFQAGVDPLERRVRVRVDDPGDGHDFDVARHEQEALRNLAEEHRGLMLIRHLAKTVEFQRRGASVVMDFAY